MKAAIDNRSLEVGDCTPRTAKYPHIKKLESKLVTENIVVSIIKIVLFVCIYCLFIGKVLYGKVRVGSLRDAPLGLTARV